MNQLSPAEMDMAKEVMTRFFKAAINIGLQATPEEVAFSHPVSHLVNEAVEKGAEGLAEELLTSFGGQGEYALNGSGLKLLWGESLRGPGSDQIHLRLAIYCDHGDGVYPSTLPALKALIKERHWSWYY